MTSSVPALVDSAGRPIRSGRRLASRSWSDSVYPGASLTSDVLGGWFARISSPYVPAHEADVITARARELVRGSGVAKTGVKRRVGMLIGAGWILSPNVDHVSLGIAPQEGRALGAKLAAQFRGWARDPLKRCHTQRLFSFDQLLRLAARERIVSGAAIGILRWNESIVGRYSTQLQLVDADRLSNPMGQPDSVTLRDGIELDEWGAPIAFHFAEAHPADTAFDAPRLTWTRVPRWDPDNGRPTVLYSFEPERAEALHGVSAFASVLEAFKQITRYSEAELGKAIVQAIYVAFIESGLPPDQVDEQLNRLFDDEAAKTWTDSQAAYYAAMGGTPRLFDGGQRMPILHPGDKVNFTTSTAGPSGFDGFTQFFLRQVAGALGLFGPQLTEDWSKVNYSSARAGLNEIWRDVMIERSDLAQDFCDPTYLAICEEGLRWGYWEEPPGAPSFYDLPEAYCRATWIGPGRGHVDPEKEAGANEINALNGFMTLEQIAAESGQSLEDLFEQLAREEAMRAEYGLEKPAPRPAAPRINVATE